MLDWSSCPEVESHPDRVSGAWVFRGTRVPVAALFKNLEDGARRLCGSGDDGFKSQVPAEPSRKTYRRGCAQYDELPRIQLALKDVEHAIDAAVSGSYAEVRVP